MLYDGWNEEQICKEVNKFMNESSYFDKNLTAKVTKFLSPEITKISRGEIVSMKFEKWLFGREAIKYLRANYANIDKFSEKEAVSTNILNFSNFSPNIEEQLLKYSFKINDVVVISSEDNMLTSIAPAELSSASSFAQIPVLLLLLYIVWIIILFGAELTYSIQYCRSYGVDKNSIRLSFAEKEVIALEFMHIIAYRFINRKKAITMYELAKELKTAPTIINEISEPVEKSMYVIKVVNGSNISYSLVCQPESITIGDIIHALKMDGGFRNKNLNSNDKYKNIIYQNKAITTKDYNTNLLNLVHYKYNKS